MSRVPILLLLLCLPACRSGEPAPPPAPRTPLPITVVTVPERTVLSLPVTGPYSGMEEPIERLFVEMETREIVPQGPLEGVFHDDPAAVPPEETRYEVRMPVPPDTGARPPFLVKRVPATRTVAVVLVGSYEEIAARYPEIYDWIEENGYEVAGPLTEVYLVGPGAGVPAASYETEVHVPVRDRGR